MSRVAVLGAGPAGLTAALEAAELGHEVVVFEAADSVGGMSGSFEIDGLRVDYGSHRLHPATDERFMARLQALLGDDLQQRQRNGRIRLRGRWIGFPLRLVDMARSLPLDFTAGVALDTIRSLRRRPAGDTFKEEIERRLGPTIHREFYEPYASKLYGLPSDELSAEVADRRVAATSPLDIVRKVIRAVRSEGRTFWYPAHGYGRLSERLADAAVDAGVDLRLSTLVQGVHPGGSWVRTEAGETSTDVVLSTLSVATLADVVEGGAPEPVRRALRDQKTRAMVLVYLTLTTEQYTPFDAHYFPETDIRMSRLSEPKNYRNGPDPDAVTVLCGEYPCWPRSDDDLWSASDAELAALLVEDLKRSGLPAVSPTNVTVRRLGSVYPVYEPGADDDRRLIQDWVESLDGILSFGRQALWVPDNMHHVMEMGSAAAHAICADGTIDRTRWRASLAAFATHVVED